MNEKKHGLPLLAAAMGAVAVTALIVCFVKVHSDHVKQTVADSMTGMIDERAERIKEYVLNSEHLIMEYSNADAITNLICDPDNKALAEAAQNYTETYSAQIENLEGIYASSYDTCILTHTKSSCIGMITRVEQKTRDALHEALESADDGIYCSGFIISPASGLQILSMYQIVRNQKNEPVGYTGLGLITDSMADDLQPQNVSGAKSTEFMMLSAADARYTFCKNDELIGKVTENERIKSLCSEVSGKDAQKEGTLEYQDESGKHIVSYSSLPEYNWLLMMDAVV